MKIQFDPKSQVWVAFHKKNGRPYLAEAKSLEEATTSIFEMIQEDQNGKNEQCTTASR